MKREYQLPRRPDSRLFDESHRVFVPWATTHLEEETPVEPLTHQGAISIPTEAGHSDDVQRVQRLRILGEFVRWVSRAQPTKSQHQWWVVLANPPDTPHSIAKAHGCVLAFKQL